AQGIQISAFAAQTSPARAKEPDADSLFTFMDTCPVDNFPECARRCDQADLEACETAGALLLSDGSDAAAVPRLAKACKGGRPTACITLASLVAQGDAGLAKDGRGAAKLYPFGQSRG